MMPESTTRGQTNGSSADANALIGISVDRNQETTVVPKGERDFPATCLSSSRGDRCAILHADATDTFYAACAFSSGGPNIRIQAFDDCQTAPGPAYGCPRTALVDVPGVNQLQLSLSENPCTGHLALVYRKSDEIRLRFYDEQLKQISDTRIRDNQQLPPTRVVSPTRDR